MQPSGAIELEQSTDVETALGAVAAEIGADVHLVTGSGALPAPGTVPFADELVDALSYRLLSLREPGEISLADGRVVVAVPVVVTAERPGPSRLVAVTAESVPRRDTVRSLVRGAEVIAGHHRGQRLVRLTRRPMAAEMLRRTLSGEATSDELAAWARGIGIAPRGHVACVVIRIPSDRVNDLHDAADALEDAAEINELKALVAIEEEGEVIAFLFPETPGERSSRMVASIERAAAPLISRSAGALGRSSVIAHGMPDLARAVHDARRVCELNTLRHLPIGSVESGPKGAAERFAVARAPAGSVDSACDPSAAAGDLRRPERNRSRRDARRVSVGVRSLERRRDQARDPRKHPALPARTDRKAHRTRP
jgi:hypothetical protein